MQKNPVLEIKNLIYKLPDTQKILFTVKNLKIFKTDKLLIKGPSGKGKTTLLHLMAGLIKSFEGEILLFDKNLASISESELNGIRKYNLFFQ